MTDKRTIMYGSTCSEVSTSSFIWIESEESGQSNKDDPEGGKRPSVRHPYSVPLDLTVTGRRHAASAP